jgi:hypothetical protein
MRIFFEYTRKIVALPLPRIPPNPSAKKRKSAPNLIGSLDV